MPRSKRLPLLILWTALLASPLIGEPSASAAPPSASDWSVDPARSYPGATVIALLDAAASEAELAIAEAYAEGYKAGLVESAPDAAYWRAISDGLRADLEEERGRFRLPWWSLPVVATGGALAGLVLGFSWFAR